MRLKTKSIYNELCQMMPGGVSSPMRALYGSKQIPLIIESACQDLLQDIDGNEYIDFCASWGALILGHAEPKIMDELAGLLKKGTSYGITSIYEHKLAKRIISYMPNIEMLRFCSSGTEATMFALRLARGFTGRDYIVKYVGNYHGGADFLLTQAGSGFATYQAVSKGIPKASVEYTLNLPYNDLEALESLFADPKYKDKIAAIIIEPVAANMGVVPAEKKYLESLRKITEENGTLLIFDEVVTGFRVGLGGAGQHYGIKADLTCLGKVVGGGFPVAAYGGKKEIMEMLSPLGPVYQEGTLSGNPLAMAAGYFVMNEIGQPDFYRFLRQKTLNFIEPIRKAIQQSSLKACIQDVGSMFTLFFGVEKVSNMAHSQSSDKEMFWKFFNYLLERKIYWPPYPHEAAFMTRAHSQDHLDYVQQIIIEFIQKQ